MRLDKDDDDEPYILGKDTVRPVLITESPSRNYTLGRPAAFHTAEEALTFKRLCLEKLDMHLLKKNSSVHTHGRSKVLGTSTRH